MTSTCKPICHFNVGGSVHIILLCSDYVAVCPYAKVRHNKVQTTVNVVESGAMVSHIVWNLCAPHCLVVVVIYI